MQLEALNNALLVGVMATFCALCGYGLPNVKPELLTHSDPILIVQALPVIPVVYVFQTVVPTLCTLLQCNMRRNSHSSGHVSVVEFCDSGNCESQ